MTQPMKIERPRLRDWLYSNPARWIPPTALPDLADWIERDGMRLEHFREDGVMVHRAELPGIDPADDLTVELDDGAVVITAERERRSNNGDGPIRSEFHYGRFVRRLPVPAGTAADDITASYRDGILEVRVTEPQGERSASMIPVERV